jgi:fatty acid desaturase/predicted heme/steroid binding protein
VAVDGDVLDVSSFLSRHPGGADQLRIAGGKDVTAVFNTYHGASVKKMFKEFTIGKLDTTEVPELPFFPESTELHEEFRTAIKDELRAKGLSRKNSPWAWVRYITIFTSVLLSQWALVKLHGLSAPLPVCLAVAALQGFACAMVGLMPLHDASHYSITKSPLVWKYLGHSHDFLNGASYLVWTYQHVLGHHPYTNIDGADPDIETAEVDVRRIKGWQPWFSAYVYQHIYAPILYAFLAWKTRVQDIKILYFTKSNGKIRVNPPTTEQTTLFILGRLFFVAYRFAWPLLSAGAPPLWQVALECTVSDFVLSWWLALTFQANHVVPKVAWPRADETGRVDMPWPELQLASTQDYAHDSWFWTTFTGSLNYQVTHHLFPGTLQVHYPVIAPAIRRVAKRRGLDYLCLDTATEAIGSHIAYLRHMGSKGGEKTE